MTPIQVRWPTTLWPQWPPRWSPCAQTPRLDPTHPERPQSSTAGAYDHTMDSEPHTSNPDDGLALPAKIALGGLALWEAPTIVQWVVFSAPRFIRFACSW